MGNSFIVAGQRVSDFQRMSHFSAAVGFRNVAFAQLDHPGQGLFAAKSGGRPSPDVTQRHRTDPSSNSTITRFDRRLHVETHHVANHTPAKLHRSAIVDVRCGTRNLFELNVSGLGHRDRRRDDGEVANEQIAAEQKNIEQGMSKEEGNAENTTTRSQPVARLQARRADLNPAQGETLGLLLTRIPKPRRRDPGTSEQKNIEQGISKEEGKTEKHLPAISDLRYSSFLVRYSSVRNLHPSLQLNSVRSGLVGRRTWRTGPIKRVPCARPRRRLGFGRRRRPCARYAGRAL